MDKNTAEENFNSKPGTDRKSDDINDTGNHDFSIDFDENDIVKAFRTQENHIDGLSKDFTLIINDKKTNVKRCYSITSWHINDDKRESEWKRFLIQQLNLDKIKEEADNGDKDIMNTPPPVVSNNRPIMGLKVSIL